MTYLTDIERLNYYEGEFLGAVDFEAEQEYHRDMRRRHNLGQHTFGIVAGLDLAQPVNGSTNANGAEVDVYLQPGMAVDGFGREIVLLSQVQLTPTMFASFYSPSAVTPYPVYVWIAYQEQLLQPSSDACATTNMSNVYGRVEETYTLTATATASAPPNGAIVVDGTQMSASSTPSTVIDPPPITLPYDDSIPFQEFSTGDSNLVWWLPLGRVTWDPYNQVFMQIVQGDPVNSAIAAASGRDYAGNVSATTYAPAAAYAVVDRNSPYPLAASNAGVQMEVAGSLQVDRSLGVNAAINLDEASANTGTLNPGLTFGYHSTEGIASNRSNAGTNPGGLDFYTKSVARLSITQSGDVQIGTGSLFVGGSVSLPATQQGAYLGWNLSGGTGETDFINNQGKGSGGFAFINTPAAGTPPTTLMTITGAGKVGIGIGSPVAPLDVASGPIHVGQTTNPTLTAQGAYIGWNMSGAAGETDFVNNQGGGSGGFAFINTPASGSPQSTLLTISGAGTVGIGIGTQAIQQSLSINAGLNIDQGNNNPGGSLPLGANHALTFGSTSGEGIGSCRLAGGVNLFGLDFYTYYQSRMSISNSGAVTIGAEPAIPLSPAPGPASLTINGNRTNLIGVDGAGMHWIMAGATAEGVNNVMGFNPSSKQITLGNSTTHWDVMVYGNLHATKIGYVADRFINRDGVALERGDVVVLNSTPSSQFSGLNPRVPLVEVELTDSAMDVRVCGIVDEPSVPPSAIGDLDPAKLGDLKVGLMVTLGAYAYCKVDADVAAIAPGDLLVTSATPGHAQKVTPSARVRPGAIIGKALGALKAGKGLIPILFSHQ